MEVVPKDDPIALPRESEGLQKYDDTRDARGYAAHTFAKQPDYRAVHQGDDDAERRLCGFRPATFWLSAALVLMVVALGAVGGGVGSRLKEVQDRNGQWWVPITGWHVGYCERAMLIACSPSSISGAPTATTVTAVSTTTVLSAAAVATTSEGLLLDFAAPAPSMISTVALDCPTVDKQTYVTRRSDTYTLSCSSGLQGGDFADIAAYSYQDCVEACASHNYWTGNATACVGVEFSSQMSGADTMDYGNCWLKDARMFSIAGTNDSLSAMLNQ
ncbi:hypothetical protein LTR53_008653 [Teratosphaeriaceae sp. CCFEE 6253]|nr:hypothetical protein LTR53_008653 [Teratosphaeriaceae sp. CCFEE 6253]